MNYGATNFLNKNNAADQRVYELLAEKFQLFDGVFGASDEVLGSIESGVDFEKRIAAMDETLRYVHTLSQSAAIEFVAATLAENKNALSRTVIVCEDDYLAMQLDG